MRNKVFRKFITIIFLLIYNIEIFAANLVVDPNSKNNTKLDKSANGVPGAPQIFIYQPWNYKTLLEVEY
ncbi:hypothetical protein RN96_11695 [Fusobacterium polymorphum]|uniref:Uncharacterized protein n=1 Tax=Fusobacterium nucleatum subsp. polymorphum TaxID=76857 RepID=A0A2B7YFC2_FUSNP|nr:hypothetical protein [Fusobacterium polymorphum]PGH20226.1 hypothetical protein RN96_11695 [Fusobacterium polymorphum]